VSRHREALLEYQLSAYPEMVDLHRTKLRELYAAIRRHCAESGLKVPVSVPRS
jgi:hypothetical protein